MFAGNYAPEGWHLCDGALLPINDNQALYSLLGTTYGGDGRTTFGVPDLRGRVLVHQGKLSGSIPATYQLGQTGGAETVTLGIEQLPVHTHTVNAQGVVSEGDTPANAFWAASLPYATAPGNATMNGAIVGTVGGNQAHANVMPFLVISFIIALQGNYPSPS